MENLITIIVRRESVCMGDDINAPYEREYSLNSDMNLEEFLRLLFETYDLPLIHADKTCWVVVINGSLVCAVMAQEENYKPRFTIESTTPILNLFPEKQQKILYFDYLTQDDPVIIFERAKQGFYKGMRWDNLKWDSRYAHQEKE